MKRILLLSALISLMSGLVCMEKIELETFKKERNKPVYYIAPEIQKQLDEAADQSRKERDELGLNLICMESRWSKQGRIYAAMFESVYRYEKIVLASGDKMSNMAKLKYLIGDSCYDLRKTIIKEMIEQENIHPDDISDKRNENLLFNAIVSNDVEFARYLLQHGANLSSILEKEEENGTLNNILLQNLEMFGLVLSHERAQKQKK